MSKEEKKIIKKFENSKYVLQYVDESKVMHHEYDWDNDDINLHVMTFDPKLFKSSESLLDFSIKELFAEDEQPKRIAQSIVNIFDFENIELNFPIGLTDEEYCKYMLDFLNDLKQEITLQIKDYKHILKQ